VLSFNLVSSLISSRGLVSRSKAHCGKRLHNHTQLRQRRRNSAGCTVLIRTSYMYYCTALQRKHICLHWCDDSLHNYSCIAVWHKSMRQCELAWPFSLGTCSAIWTKIVHQYTIFLTNISYLQCSNI